MSRSRIATIVGTAFVIPAVIAAQAPTVRNAAVLLPDCPYRRCELTYIPGRFGGRLEVGVGVLSEIGGGFSGGGIVQAVAAVPEAARIARRGQVFQGGANTIRLLAVVGTVVLWGVAARSPEPSLARLFGTGAGLTVFFVAPLVPQSVAHDEFGRSTDAYNRELAR